MGECFITRRGAVNTLNKFPEFEYNGTYEIKDDGKTDDGVQNWRIKFLTGGTLTFTRLSTLVDIFVVGGGASGGGRQGGGGGGGRTKSLGNIRMEEGVEYTITVGGGGTRISGWDAWGNAGGTSSVKNGETALISVAGGSGGGHHSAARDGGAGGSGGGASSTEWGMGAGGSDGGNGGDQGDGDGKGGKGQGFSTREFWEIDENAEATLYAGGGGGGGGNWAKSGGAGGGGAGGWDGDSGSGAPVAGSTNLGGGGGGGAWANSSIGYGAVGGSGIVIIRNIRS